MSGVVARGGRPDPTRGPGPPSADPVRPETRLRVEFMGGLVACHLAAPACPFLFAWDAVAVAAALWLATSCLGVTLGFHRLLTHGSFDTFPAVRYAAAALGCLAHQGPPSVWVGIHRLHHKYTDRPGDPHSPADRFWWGHMLWVFSFPPEVARRYARDLLRDPVMAAIDRHWVLPQFALAAALYAAGGWPWVVWGVAARVVLTIHSAWLVNSAGHRWGYRNFDTPDGSRNNWWVALLSFGEGWHNNHHHSQRSAAHGVRPWEVDATAAVIWAMRKLGLAWNVVPAPALTHRSENTCP